MGAVFLYLFLIFGDDAYGPEVHVFDTPEQCQQALSVAVRDAEVLKMFADVQQIRMEARAGCLTLQELEDVGIKAA